MKFKNKYINKLIASGLVGSLLLSSNPFNSFANNQEFNINNINETTNTEEISPQMLAVISSLAVGAGITITTYDDLYDLGKLFYDYIQSHNDLTWDSIQSMFIESNTIMNNSINIHSNFLNIVKGFFDNCFNDSIDKVVVPGLPIAKTIDLTADKVYYGNGGLYSINDISGGRSGIFYYSELVDGPMGFYAITRNYDSIVIDSISIDYKTYYSKQLKIVGSFIEGSTVFNNTSFTSFDEVPSCIVSVFPYAGGYAWDNIDSKKENDKVDLPIPGNLANLVGQTSEEFWNNTNNLINPCTQEVILPEIENPSIAIGESLKSNTINNCSIYNEEILVQKAEESKDIADIENARDLVNKLPEGDDKDNLQDRLDAIIPNITLTSNSATANLDVYIKSENMLSLTLSTNSVTFEDYSGIDEIEQQNAVEISINSSLPYQLNAYLVDEMYNKDKTKKIDMDRLQIKDNTDTDYKEFTAINEKLVLKDSCESGNDKIHNIDLKLKGGNAYESDIYKTVIKFEAEQK